MNNEIKTGKSQFCEVCPIGSGEPVEVAVDWRAGTLRKTFCFGNTKLTVEVDLYGWVDDLLSLYDDKTKNEIIKRLVDGGIDFEALKKARILRRSRGKRRNKIEALGSVNDFIDEFFKPIFNSQH